jgi:hypothetical protein
VNFADFDAAVGSLDSVVDEFVEEDDGDDDVDIFAGIKDAAKEEKEDTDEAYEEQVAHNTHS